MSGRYLDNDINNECAHNTQTVLKGYVKDAIVCMDCNKIIGWE